MTNGRPRRLLGPTVGSAVVLAVLGLIVWAVALWVSWGGSCPPTNQAASGLDKGISVWPPAAQCTNPQGDTFWHEALPWATWVVGALIVAAAAVLLTGLIVAIRDLRRPAPAASRAAVPLLEASGPYAGPPSGQGVRRDDEADRPRMAA